MTLAILRRSLLIICCAACGHQHTSAYGNDGNTVAILQDFASGIDSVHARNPAVRLRVDPHPLIASERVLVVEYPRPSGDPAGRDIWFDVRQRNWTSARAIAFQVKPDHPTSLSVSFADRNHVAFTMWLNLPDTSWQMARVVFESIRPNPYFQPPDAVVGRPLDLSEVKGVGFAPQDSGSGRVAIRRLVLSK